MKLEGRITVPDVDWSAVVSCTPAHVMTGDLNSFLARAMEVAEQSADLHRRDLGLPVANHDPGDED